MKRLFASCFGLGWLPIAPGTWGSLPPVVVFALMRHFNLSPVFISIFMVIFVLVGSVICVKYAPASIAVTGKTDPPEVVADEFAGQSLTLVFTCALTNPPVLAATIGGFLLFRFFDIVKPWPIRKLEKFPQGWGVLADDLLAGVYAGVALLLFLRLYSHWSLG